MKEALRVLLWLLFVLFALAWLGPFLDKEDNQLPSQATKGR